MSHKLKTLIVFDTNSLRSTIGGKVVYSSFEFGGAFKIIEEYILGNNLQNDVALAIPAWAIVELKDQKERQYEEDLAVFKTNFERLKNLPHFSTVNIDEAEFNCADFVHQKSEEYLATKTSINIIELKEEKANEVLKSMMVRVLKEQKTKRPFSHSGVFKDAGFKDNLIWESILNYEELTNFDKLVFLTKDGDYTGCEYEFRGRWDKHIEIKKDEASVIAEIEKDYKNYIDFRQLYTYANSAYFKDYLSDIFTPKTTIFFEDEDCTILNFKVEEYCTKVEMTEDEDGDFTMPVIFSRVIINAKKANEDKVDIPLEIQTKYTDVDYMELFSTTGIEDLS